MVRYGKWLVLVGGVLAMAGCDRKVDKVFSSDAQWILAAPDTFEFLTVDPSRETPPAGTKILLGTQILGEAPVTDKAVQERLVEGLYDAVRSSDGSAAGCFNPRHAIRATRGGKKVELLICFQCQSLQVYTDGVRGGGLLTRAPEAYFNEVAAKLGLPVAPKDGV